MSGRNGFKRNRVVISLLSKVIPRFVLSLFCFCLDSSESKVALLLRYLFINKDAELGDATFFGRSSVFKSKKNLTIGDNVSIHAYSYLDAFGGIVIGDNVSIAHSCSFVTFEHTWEDMSIPIKYNPTVSRKITIESDVWIGCGVRVLSGSHIQSRVVVAAGAVVKGELESGYLYGGIPARKIKKISP